MKIIDENWYRDFSDFPFLSNFERKRKNRVSSSHFGDDFLKKYLSDLQNFKTNLKVFATVYNFFLKPFFCNTRNPYTVRMRLLNFQNLKFAICRPMLISQLVDKLASNGFFSWKDMNLLYNFNFHKYSEKLFYTVSQQIFPLTVSNFTESIAAFIGNCDNSPQIQCARLGLTTSKSVPCFFCL